MSPLRDTNQRTDGQQGARQEPSGEEYGYSLESDSGSHQVSCSIHFAHKSWYNLSSVCKKPKVKKNQPSKLLTHSLGRLGIFVYKGGEFGAGWGGGTVKEKLRSIITQQSQTAGRDDEEEQEEVPVATQTTDHQCGRRGPIW